jgi:hypothetical protein
LSHPLVHIYMDQGYFSPRIINSDTRLLIVPLVGEMLYDDIISVNRKKQAANLIVLPLYRPYKII